MSLFSRLTEKSWETPGAVAYAEPGDYRPSAEKVGLLTYFCVALVLFSLITASYLMRMTHGAVEGLPHDWRSIPRPALLWVNTAVLILASLVWEAARHAARNGHKKRMRDWLFAGGALGFLFLAGQLIVWRQLHDAGYFLAGPSLCLSDWSGIDQPALHFVSSNPAIGFFFLITAIHGLHIAGGLGAWSRAVARLTGGREIGSIVDLSAIYWHFLLAVWLAMFGLMLMT